MMIVCVWEKGWTAHSPHPIHWLTCSRLAEKAVSNCVETLRNRQTRLMATVLCHTPPYIFLSLTYRRLAFY